ncbi:MAG: DNRLRE domain-containing protein [Firmicutes bacterium]|nr:DNRLRE domain-containing protein [Bacillota bacterium]
MNINKKSGNRKILTFTKDKKNMLQRLIALIVLLIFLFEPIAGAADEIVNAINTEEANTVEVNAVNTEEANTAETNAAANTNETADEMKTPPITAPAKDAAIIGENTDKKTRDTNTYFMNDGTETVAMYNEAVNYDNGGKWEPIDNSLSDGTDDANDAVLQNAKNKYQVKFAKKAKSDKLLNIKIGSNQINWSLNGANKVEITKESNNAALKNETENDKKMKMDKASSSVRYAGILSNVDLQYVLLGDKIKENIILKNADGAKNSLVFTLDIGNLGARLNDTKQIEIYDEGGSAIYVMDTPYMYDATLDGTDNIDVKLEQTGKTYQVTIVPNQEWLANAVYPVTIDPTINTSLYRESIDDTFIYADQGTTPKGAAQLLRAGNGKVGTTLGSSRSLIKFTLPPLNSGDQVVAANLNICSYPKTTEWTPSARQIQLDVHRMTSDWNEATAIWSNTSSSYNYLIEDFAIYQFDYNDQYKSYNFDITSIAKDWYTTGNNYGLMIKEHTENSTTSGNEAYFLSADTSDAFLNGRPLATIVYRNQTGLENYLNYHTKDVGRAGTVYTNDYNGNVTLIHPDLSTPGQRMPAAVYHVYNTNDKDTEIGYGAGYRLNLSQSLTWQILNINNEAKSYIKYIDEDGTAHYFTSVNGIWTDEDGLGLTLTGNGTLTDGTWTMQDKAGNKSTFYSCGSGTFKWYLKEIADESENKITIDVAFRTDGIPIITKVTDAVGDVINFGYSQYGSLTAMTDPNGRTLSYSYRGADLVAVYYPVGVAAEYDFNANHLLITVLDRKAGAIYLDYNTERTSRVRMINEQSTAWETGNVLYMTYGNNVTTFTDSRGYSNTETFNNWGQATALSDFGTGTQDLSKAYGKSYTYGTSGGEKNKLTLEGNLESPVNNLLMNGSAEYDGYWSLGQWNSIAGPGSFSSDTAYSGKRSLKLVNNYDAGEAPLYQQIVNGAKGKTYTLSAEIKMLPTSTVVEGAFLYVQYCDASGKFVGFTTNRIKTTNNTWEKYSLTVDYPANATSPLYVGVCLAQAKGTGYFDCIQLEEGAAANTYNMVENSSFWNAADKWEGISINPSYDNTFGDGSAWVLRLTGDETVSKNYRQRIETSGKAGDVYSFSGWAKNLGIPNNGARVCTITVGLVPVGSDAVQFEDIYIDPNISGYQYGEKQFIAKYDYSAMYIYLTCYNNANYMQFTNIGLYKDVSGNSYKYDANGNLVNSQDAAKQQSTFNYDGNNNLSKAVNPKGGSFTYTYDATYKHRLTKALSNTGVAYNFYYNSLGSAVASQVTSTNTSDYIETNVAYTTNDKYLANAGDEEGNTTIYTYNDKTGTLANVKDANGNTTNYVYDNMDRATEVNAEAGGLTYKNNYTYLQDRLNTIAHNGTTYSFIYDNFGNQSAVKVGSQTLITNTYEANNGKLTNAAYGNGQSISYAYDRFNRITRETKSTGTVDYTYDARGNVYQAKDSGLNETVTASYDLINRPTTVTNTNGLTTSYKYDANSNVSGETYVLGGTTNTSTYNYDSSNRITSVATGAATITSAYDGLSRTTSKTLAANSKTFATTFGYKNTAIANRTTTKVASMKNGSEELAYTYDSLGNIQTVSRAGTQIAKYYYDALGQLTREDNKDIDKTITYVYDLGGNIITKKEYTYTQNAEINTTPTQTMAAYVVTGVAEQTPAYSVVTGINTAAVTITYPNGAAAKEYRICKPDGTTVIKDWTAYTSTLTITENCIIYARSAGSSGQYSSVPQCSISNISQTMAAYVVTGATSQTPAYAVTAGINTAAVNITYPNGAKTKEYRICKPDGVTVIKDWTAYVSTLTITENCIIYARSAGGSGQYSSVPECSISNISQTMAAYTITGVIAPSPSYSVTTGMNTATVNILYPDGAKTKEYRICKPDGTTVIKDWTAYANTLTITENCIIYARSAGDDGQYSAVPECKISNISTTGPTTLINTMSYAYGNSNWKDQLTAYNGNAITYDQIRQSANIQWQHLHMAKWKAACENSEWYKYIQLQIQCRWHQDRENCKWSSDEVLR